MKRVLEPEVMDTPDEANHYDAMDNSAPNRAFVERLVELKASGSMLDIGCGPGHIPLLVCECLPEARVVGIDLSENMLRHARRRLAASPFGERIDYRLGNATALDFPDAAFDSVFSNTILHHLPDPESLLREAARLLRPGGTLLIRDLFRPESPERVAELVQEHAAQETATNRELFRASLCAALSPEELRRTADAAGLELAELTIDSDRHMSLQIAAT
jgi:ubiquinone/menaquinone biosynthesis C-methylase UbiE